MSQQDKHRKISMIWHRFLGLDRNDGHHHPVKREREVYNEEQDRMRAKRAKRLCNVDIRAQFRQMTGRDDIEFRGNQEAVIKSITQGQTPIIQIVGTGTGKSLSFMLPAYCEPRGVPPPPPPPWSSCR